MSALLFLRIASGIVVTGVAVYQLLKFYKLRNTRQEQSHHYSAGNFDGSTLSMCCICFQKLSGNNDVSLPCKHKFHKDCIKLLFTEGNNRTCPLCRRMIPTSLLNE